MELKQLVDVAYAQYGDMDLINMALTDKKVWLEMDDLYYLSTIQRGLTEMEQNENNYGLYVDLRLGERTVTWNYRQKEIVIQASQQEAFFNLCREEQRMRDYIDAHGFIPPFMYHGPYLVAHLRNSTFQYLAVLLTHPDTNEPLITKEEYKVVTSYFEKLRLFLGKNALYQLFGTENDTYEEHCARPFRELEQMKQQIVERFMHIDVEDVTHFTLVVGDIDNESISPLQNSGRGSFQVVKAKDNTILFDSNESNDSEEMDMEEPE